MTLNSRGQILHGVGNGVAAIDNEAFAPGAAGGWITDDLAFYADPMFSWAIARYDTLTRERRRLVPDETDPLYGKGANALFAGGGVWAAWLAGTGLFASTGFALARGGLLGVGPDGAIAYKPDYQAEGPSRIRERDGRDYQLTNGHAYDLFLIGGGGAIWQERGRLQTRGLATPLQVGAAWRPQAFAIAGRWWVSYYSDRAGVILHPVDELVGYVLSPAGVDCWHTARRLTTGTIRFALSTGEAEQPGQVRAADVDFTQPPRYLGVVEKEPGPIDKKLPPPPTDPPLQPPPPSVAVRPYRIEGHMETERGYLIGAQGKYLRGDASQVGIMGKGTFLAIVDADTPSEACEFELETRPDGHTARHVPSGLLLEEDATAYSGALDRQYYLKPATDPPIGYAVLTVRVDTDGTIYVFKKYDHREQNKPTFVAAALCWVKK